MPSTIDAMAMTVDTPMTTPRIVSAERPLATRNESKATPMFSVRLSTKRRTRLIAASSFGVRARPGAERAGPRRGIDPEHDADARAEREGERHRPDGDPRRKG